VNLSNIQKKLKCSNTPASERTRLRHIRRIEKMTAAIQDRFPEVRHPNQIKLKHCRWIQENWLSEATAKDYRTSLRLLIRALGREECWAKPLNMHPRSRGGRPASLTVVRSRSPKFGG
jgi:hypothetical protein